MIKPFAALTALFLTAGTSGAVQAQVDAPPPGAPAAPVAATEPADTRPQPAYRLRLAIDLPVLGGLTTITVTRLFRTGSAYCAPLCDRKNVNSFDRVTAGYYSNAWQKAGDYGLYGILVGAAAVLGIDEGPAHGLNDAVVVTESIMAAAAFSSALTMMAQRPRPYLYTEKSPMSSRTGPNGAMSFLSGHAAVGFAAASSLFITEWRLHPDSAGPWVVAAAGGAVASFISVARVMGGSHFISDNLLGALAGVSMGVLFPALHDAPVRVAPMVGEASGGLAVQGAF
jgi:membrane-associated phospholipid phosphatase